MTLAYLKPTCRILRPSDLQMPILAQTGQQTTFNQSSTQNYDENGSSCIGQGPLVFNFNLGGVTPNGDGTLTVSATGDLNNTGEFYTIAFEGVGDLSPTVGVTGGQVDCTSAVATGVFNITLAQLQNAAGDGVIQVTATPEAAVGCFCDVSGDRIPNQVTVTLNFPGTT